MEYEIFPYKVKVPTRYSYVIRQKPPYSGGKMVTRNFHGVYELDGPRSSDGDLPVPILNRWIDTLNEFTGQMPFTMAAEYYQHIAALQSAPYQHYHTKSIALPRKSPLSSANVTHLGDTVNQIVRSCKDRLSTTTNNYDWLDEVIGDLMEYWHPAEALVALPKAYVELISECDEQRAFTLLRRLPFDAWSCIPETILAGPWAVAVDVWEVEPTRNELLKQSLTFTWKLFVSCQYLPHFTSTIEEILDAVSRVERVSITPCLIAMGKSNIFHGIFSSYRLQSPEDRRLGFQHPLLPAETTVQASRNLLEVDFEDEDYPRYLPGFVLHRWYEGQFHTLTELMECCCSSELPSMAAETIEQLWGPVFRRAVHPTSQLRFALCLRTMFDTWTSDNPHTLHSCLNLKLFDIYAPIDGNNLSIDDKFPWLDSPEARRIVKDTLVTYLGQLSCTEYPEIFSRVQEIINQLDVQHPDKGDAPSETAPIGNIAEASDEFRAAANEGSQRNTVPGEQNTDASTILSSYSYRLELIYVGMLDIVKRIEHVIGSYGDVKVS
ncbi:hypothetical protein C8R43DRAFT_947813 [Mycena crocata]|nr:hypothetical protein C8R43DRAFT_947813 [Mycena crocata]